MPRALGFATVTILRALADGVGYGLDVMSRTDLPSGTVYPALQRLERMGYVTARWEAESVARAEGRPRRRYYRLTGSGATALKVAIRRFGELAASAPDIVPSAFPRPGETS